MLSCGAVNYAYEVVLIFKFVGEMRKYDQMKATEQYLTLVLCILLYKMVLTFE